MYELKEASDPQIKNEVLSNYIGGINVFQDEQNIKPGELLDGKNILINIDGISARPGTQKYGQEKDSKVLGGIGYYKSTGQRELLRFSGTTLQKYINGVPIDISGTTYTASARMEMIQVRDKIWIFNGKDNLSYYDGASITVFAPLTTPADLTVSPQGTTGTTTYSYRVSAFNDTGETLACTSVVIQNGNAVLNATNNNKLTWTAVAGAKGYNIYGRRPTGLKELLITSVYEVTEFVDNGKYAYDSELGIDIGQTTLPPEENSTQGVKGTMCAFWQGRIYTAGNKDYPSRLYFGGVGVNVGNFSLSSVGGGYVDVSLNDGAIIRDIIPFQNGIIVFKDNAIYKFSFNLNTGASQLEEITRAFGGISFRGARHVENDIVFPARKDGRLAFFSLGNQEGYMSSVLRTNELSIKIAPLLVDVNLSKIQFCASGYFNNLYMCAIPTKNSEINNRVWKLDTRFGSWTYDEGIYPNFFTEYTDTQGVQKFYYGDEKSGHMVEMFSDVKTDSGEIIDVYWRIKDSNQGISSKEKIYYDSIIELKDVSSNTRIKGNVYLNGKIETGTFDIANQKSGGVGFGAYLPGGVLFGGGMGSLSSIVSDNTIQEIYFVKQARSIGFAFSCQSKNPNFKFMSLTNNYEVLSQKRGESEFRTYLESK